MAETGPRGGFPQDFAALPGLASMDPLIARTCERVCALRSRGCLGLCAVNLPVPAGSRTPDRAAAAASLPAEGGARMPVWGWILILILILLLVVPRIPR